MNFKLERPICFYDLECTGISTVKDKIVQICIIKLHPDGAREVYKQYINPGMPIPPESIAVHGITDEKVKDCPQFPDVAAEILAFFAGADIAGYNSNQYDVPLLIEEFARANMNFPHEDTKLIDMSVIFRKKEPRTLTAALKFYANKDLEGAHDAQNDVEATIDVFVGQCQKYEDIAQMSINQLHDYCTRPGVVDYGGKLRKNPEGDIVFTFGKHKDQPVKNHPDYAKWMLNSDFPSDTKNILRKLIEL